MEANKLTINPETLRFQKMGKGKKVRLRRQNVIDLIKSKPYGTLLTARDFAAVTQTRQNSAWSLVRTMVRKGIISQDEIGKHKYTFRINGDVTTRKLLPPPPPTETTTEPDQPEETTAPVAEPVKTPEPSVADSTPAADLYGDIIAEAKEYYWQTNDNDLHSFVGWLKEKGEAK